MPSNLFAESVVRVYVDYDAVSDDLADEIEDEVDLNLELVVKSLTQMYRHLEGFKVEVIS